MSTFFQRCAVPIEYPVHFIRGAFRGEALAETLAASAGASTAGRRRARALFVVDRGVADAWPGLLGEIRRYVAGRAAMLELAGEPAVVDGGEACKTERSLEEALRLFDERRLDRHAVVVAVGGGALLDLVGLAASLTHRGLRLLRMPTTVLSQADSGVGVKNGINAFGKKNFLGTFAPPDGVVCDVELLGTLSDRDWVAGLAEAVKVSLVKDAAFFDWIGEHAGAILARELDAMGRIVARSAELHLEHIGCAGDPFERGSARPLDFGHWAAHKLESLSGHRLRHGEAVAIGMAIDAAYSADLGLLDGTSLRRVLGLLARLGLPLGCEELGRLGDDGAPEVLSGLEEFREHLGGELTVTLLAGIGLGLEVHAMDRGRLARVVGRLARGERP